MLYTVLDLLQSVIPPDPGPCGGCQPEILETTPNFNFFAVKSWQKHCKTTCTLPMFSLHSPNWKSWRNPLLQRIANQYVQRAPPNLQSNHGFWHCPRCVSNLWSSTGNDEYLIWPWILVSILKGINEFSSTLYIFE